ncbi:MAG: PIN domain-containing protein [Spirochaetales bacterium]|nr:PIN domain-containing protein [Spirochaetales bacterium]
MKKVLLDTNIILDIALKRKPHFTSAFRLFALIDQGVIEAFVTGSSITDLFYIVRRDLGSNLARNFLIELVEVVPVIGVDHSIIVSALNSEIKDFEDAVQVFSAISSDINTIITRNKKDFANTHLTILTPDEFLSLPDMNA